MDSKAALAEGRKILDPVLERYGFRFEASHAGSSSGGGFASGIYVRGDRRLEVHFRHGLGLVTYHFGDRSFSHEVYMWSVLGRAGGNAYPGFSTDPVEAFRNLAADLERYAQEFLAGSDEILKKRFADAAAHPRPKGLKGTDSSR